MVRREIRKSGASALLRSLCLVTILFASEALFSQQYNFTTFTSTEGLPQPYVYAVFQDRDGYLWAGTGDGLARYNGFELKSFNTSDSLSENFITTGFPGKRYTWFGHRGGGITFTDGRIFRKVRYNWNEPESVTHFAEDESGNLWVSFRSKGIYQVYTEGVIDTSDFIQPGGLEINSFEFTGMNEVIAGTTTGLVYLIRKNKSVAWESKPVAGFEGIPVCEIRKTGDGAGYYIATVSDGIYRIKKEGDDFQTRKIDTGIDDLLNPVQGICEDNLGNLWIATFGNGLIKLTVDNGNVVRKELFNKDSGYSSDNIKAVFIDRNGIVWTGNYGEGLTRITPELFSVHIFDEAYGNNINSIFSDGVYRWLGTGKGLIKSEEATGKIIKFYSVKDGLPVDTVTAVYEDPDKNIWIGTAKKGLFCLDNGAAKVRKYWLSDGILENDINVITGRNDNIWIGTWKGVCHLNRLTGETKWYSVSSGGLPHNYVNSVFLDGYNQVWVSTNSSVLACIRDNKVTKMQFNTGSTGIYTLGPITEDNQSRIWVGTSGSGVFVVDNDTIFYLSSKENLLSDFCYSIAFDRNEHVWIGHRDGLSRIKTSDMSVKQIRSIDVFTGGYQLNQNAMVADIGKNIWIGTNQGLICYEQSGESPVLEPPSLSISSVKVNDEDVSFEGNRLSLAPGGYRIKIEFIGIDLSDAGQVIYQYQLEGWDMKPEITRERSVIYRRLSDGDYKFVLRAANGEGVSSPEPVYLEIVIRKPVWKKFWFYAVSVICISLIITWLIRRRFRRLVAEKKLLEDKVQERTREIQEQKNEIEKQHDIIEERNTNITASIKYASNIQRAMLTSSETINSLLQGNFILSRPKDIVSGDFYWVTGKDDLVVVVVADCTGHGVPGALMSMLGIASLNEIVDIHGITRPDMIVTALRERLVKSLKQERINNAPVDGMDIAVCTLDRTRNKLLFTGGFNDLVYVSEGKMTVFKADRISVSAALHDSGTYKLNELQYRKGDMIYLFSDGYMDQFGGDFAKKFLRVHFYTTLLEVSVLPVNEQQKFLEEKLQGWMKDHTQTDDITVMGIRL